MNIVLSPPEFAYSAALEKELVMIALVNMDLSLASYILRSEGMCKFLHKVQTLDIRSVGVVN